MTPYKVSFFKNLLSADGHPFRCLQQTIEVHASSPERAVQAAKLRYQRLRRIPSWKLHADILELDIQGARIEPHLAPRVIHRDTPLSGSVNERQTARD